MTTPFSFINSNLFMHRPVKSVDDFQCWMLMACNDPPENPSSEVIAPQASTSTLDFTPRTKSSDPLFWCVYAIIHFSSSGTWEETRMKELHEKIAAVKWISEHRSTLWGHLTLTRLQEYTADIMSTPQTTWGALYLLCRYYQINVRVVGPHMYMDFVGSDVEDAPIYRIQRENATHFHVHGIVTTTPNVDSDKIAQDFRETKPLRGIGNYKVDDLKSMATRLGLTLEGSGSKKKQDWYNAVYKALTW